MDLGYGKVLSLISEIVSKKTLMRSSMKLSVRAVRSSVR
jgi:hypothetical protein